MLGLTGGLKHQGMTNENISDTSKKFIMGVWPLPTFALVILAALALIKVMDHISYERSKKKNAG
ncbi:hypothetical protein K440DRAFT_610547 [Wilcoxina mikolae CBS 423.85]|nr:hypothetical protein K440DRAFT_610547 [Wilcoxina mikolae CBS 423.85]